MLLSVIVINYKTWEKTSDCVKSLYRSLDKKIESEVIVVDNGSGEDEIKQLQKLRDELGFKLLISKENLGFSKGCNFGASMAEGELLLFLNSDTEVSGGIMEMAKYLNDGQKIGILGGGLTKENGVKEKSAGNFLNLLNLALMLWGGERLGLVRFAPSKIKKVDWVSGGCLMVRKNLFDRLNGFDEDYFMYVEDMDLCSRARKLAFDTYFYPNVSIVHKSHGSSSREFAIVNIYRSLLVYYKKNKSELEYNVARSILYTKALFRLFFGRVLGKNETVRTYTEVLKFF